MNIKCGIYFLIHLLYFLQTASVKARFVSTDEPYALSTNINGVLEAFEVMGHGIVESIKTYPDRWEM